MDEDDRQKTISTILKLMKLCGVCHRLTLIQTHNGDMWKNSLIVCFGSKILNSSRNGNMVRNGNMTVDFLDPEDVGNIHMKDRIIDYNNSIAKYGIYSIVFNGKALIDDIDVLMLKKILSMIEKTLKTDEIYLFNAFEDVSALSDEVVFEKGSTLEELCMRADLEKYD